MEPLTVPATLDSLEPLGRFVKDAAAPAGLTAKSAYNLRLAVDELATNIVTHGYPNRAAPGNIRIAARIAMSDLVVTLEDDGIPFDPRTVRPPEGEIAKPLDERQVGGLGIFLVLRSVDGFDYQRTPTANRVILTMRRPAPGPRA